MASEKRTGSLLHDLLALVLGRGEARVGGRAPAEEVAQAESREPATSSPTLAAAAHVATLPPAASLG